MKKQASKLCMSDTLVLFTDIPIDINTAQRFHPIPTREYYCYGDLNYIIHNCPARLDIWLLTIEKWEKLMKDLNVLKDVEIAQQLELMEQEELDSKLSNY